MAFDKMFPQTMRYSLLIPLNSSNCSLNVVYSIFATKLEIIEMVVVVTLAESILVKETVVVVVETIDYYYYYCYYYYYYYYYSSSFRILDQRLIDSLYLGFSS